MSATISFLMYSLSIIVVTCDGDGSPILKVHAYQREIVPGVPGSPQGKGAEAGQKQYSIYLETDPAFKFEIVGVWMNGTEYSVESMAKPSPVRFDNPVVFEQEERNIAVPKTGNQVTEVILKTSVPDKSPDKAVTQLLKKNKAVVELTSGGKTILAPVEAFQKRDPLYLR